MNGLRKQGSERFRLFTRVIAIVTVMVVGWAVIHVLKKTQSGAVNPSSEPAWSSALPEQGAALVNSVGMKLVYIRPGEFVMGSRDSATQVAEKSATEEKLYADEHPRHRVKISKGFYMGATEVTQEQWKVVNGSDPSHFKGDDLPVDTVNWADAETFCRNLSRKEGRKYRLPTEAEWEYACRAGTTTPFYTGETISTEHANYDGDYIFGNAGRKGDNRKKTTAVASFGPNGFGLYDMHGNVWEWCSDWYDKDYYSNSPATDPQGPSSGRDRSLRGGSWLDSPWSSRSANRSWGAPTFRIHNYGFRVVLDLE